MTSPLFVSMRNAGTYFAAAIVVACGVSDRKVNEGAFATASVAGSSSAADGDQGGTSEGGAPSSSSGEAGAAGAAKPDCINNSLRCADDTTPSECVDGTWVDLDPCPASKPACGNGVCGAATLSGGLVTVSSGVLSTNTVRLVEHGFEYAPTLCGTVGTEKVCITGGIRP